MILPVCTKAGQDLSVRTRKQAKTCPFLMLGGLSVAHPVKSFSAFARPKTPDRMESLSQHDFSLEDQFQLRA